MKMRLRPKERKSASGKKGYTMEVKYILKVEYHERSRKCDIETFFLKVGHNKGISAFGFRS